VRGTLTIDDTKFRNSLNELHKLGIPASKIIATEAARFVKTCVNFTPPTGGKALKSGSDAEGMTWRNVEEDVGAREQGMRAVARHIRRIAEPVDDGLFDYVVKRYNEKKPGSNGRYASEVIFMSGSRKCIVDWRHIGYTVKDLKDWHESKRSKPRYRTPYLRSKREELGRWKAYEWMVCKRSVFDRYVRSVQSRVGEMKAGWYPAAMALGVKLPPWVRKNYKQNGYVIDGLSSVESPSITIGNTTQSVGVMVGDAVQSALNIRAEAIAKNVLRMVKYGPGKMGTFAEAYK